CQVVTKGQVEALLAEMKAASEKFDLRVGKDEGVWAYGSKGTVSLAQSGKNVLVKLVGKNGFNYSLLEIRPEGIYLHSGLGTEKDGVGIAVGVDYRVKLIG
ncbi:MAG: hypothetical protein OK436_05195, partial [Thaumarchaeota archaeon]|nr:hypothetical protein [Nitrososphaerota archaeon]